MIPATLFGGHHFLSVSNYSPDGHERTLTLLRRWVTERQEAVAGSVTLPDQHPLEITEPSIPGLVPITVAMPEIPPSGEIKIEIHRNQMLISITWPVSQSTSCADWLRDLLR